MASNALFTKRLTFEIKKLEKEKTELSKSGIFISFDEDDIKIIYIVIFGSENTPYEFCPFFFKLEISDEYPYKPPKATFMTSDNKTRFNPNLYVSGKVCLSILGTWQGPGWTSVMNITTVIMSIYGLVMNEYPLTNEPGYETSDLIKKENYNYYVEYNSINYALCHQILNMEKPYDIFKKDIIEYFMKFSTKIIDKIDKRIGERNNKQVICSYNNINTIYDYNQLKEKVINLIQKIK